MLPELDGLPTRRDLLKQTLTAVTASRLAAWSAVGFDTVNVKDFGAMGDGSTDDSIAIADANSAAAAALRPLLFPPGTYKVGTSSFSVDLTKTQWINPGGAALQWTGNPVSGYGVRLVGTSNYTWAWASARTLVMPSLLGGSSASPYTGIALQFGDGTTYTQLVKVSVSVQGFSGCVDYQDNVWRITLDHCKLAWGNITTPQKPVNFGEAMSLRDCFIHDGATFTLNGGDWNLSGGSLNNASLVVNGITDITWTKPHIENPGSTLNAPLFIDIAGAQAICRLKDVNFVLNNPGGGGITDAPFRVSPSNTTGGLEIDGIQYTQQPYYNTTQSDDYRCLVRSAGGRVRIKNVSPLSFSNFNYIIGSDQCNFLSNGGFEAADLIPWNTTRGAGTAVQDSTLFIAGKRVTSAKSLKLTVTSASTYKEATQGAPVEVGQLVTLQVWGKGDGIAGHDGLVSIGFLDSSGGPMPKTANANLSSSNASFSLLACAAFAPAGARSVLVILNCQYGSANGSIWFDEAVLNIA